ncbi:MAG: TolC family protein [Gammaproteobacteria bacterium]|nr:TolC family protein [Gammaproteobacteria bacterium]MDH3363523.1 TolC family protein [Gammaproteobacteria bacterium]MDH3481384.1 TolC family protein [Gammaproteobacteria bacterium]
MFLICGRLPELKYVRGAAARRSAMLYILFILGTLFPPTASAQQRVPLTLAEAEDLALAAEPGQQAMKARAAALEARAVVAGQLPDPMLRIGLNNFPVQSGGFRTEGMTNAAIGLRQAFPAGKTRAHGARQLDLLAVEMSENADARGRNVLTATRTAWLDLYYWGQAHDLVAESRPIFDDLATVTRSLYSVGRKSQQDVLRAELELNRLQDRLIDIERHRSVAQAALGEWIGRDAARPVALKLPGWDQIPSLESLEGRLPEHPAMRAANAQIKARSAGVDLASERSRPGWAVDVGYSYREGQLTTAVPRSDFVSLVVTVDLPIFRKKSVDSTLSAALQERSAAMSAREQALRALQSQLAAEYARWHDLTRRLSLYETRILDQAKDHAEASLLAYQSNRADFADVMRASIDYLNTRIDHIRLKVERAQSYAVLANLGGLPR